MPGEQKTRRLPLITPLECPNCRAPIARIRVFLRTAWSRWRCDTCDALLGVDTRRRVLAIVPWTAIVIVLVLILRVTQFGLFIAGPILLGLAIFHFFIFDRVVVHERTGVRCRQCGYDLHGQTDDRCPECGETFDRDRLETDEAGVTGKHSSRAWIGIALGVIIGGITLLLVGLIVFQKMRGP